MHVTRRQLLAALAAASAPLALGGCGGFALRGDRGSVEGTLTFTTWGTDGELAGLRSGIEEFEAANSGARIELNAVPYEQMFTNIDAQLQAGTPPDLFRVPYYLFGGYAGRGQLLDLSPYLDADFGGRFTPAAWAAVQSTGSPHGVPHHTDTSVLLYDVDALAAAGITTVPQAPEEAWSWEEFSGVLAALRDSLPSSQYPLAWNWQGNGVTRWLSWLFQADGRFLDQDLTAPAIDSANARRALDYTAGLFRDGLVPPTNSISSSTYAADSWFAGTVPLVGAGAFLLPDAEANQQRAWGATFPPRDVRAAGDFGGNALVVTAQSEQPDLAVRFLDFLTQREPMERFCVGASLLPTRRDLVEDGIEFEVRPELSPVFVGQAAQVARQDAAQVASPDMAGIIAVLGEQLENAFVGGQDTESTIAALSDGIGGVIR